MALNWCYNEPWPTLANNSIISYPAQPKESFKDVTDACRPKMSSARIPKFSWTAGEKLSVGLWLLNDSPEPIPAGSVEASIEILGINYPVSVWNHPGTEANKNLEGPTVELLLPDAKVEGFTEMKLKLKAGDISSEYRLLYK